MTKPLRVTGAGRTGSAADRRAECRDYIRNQRDTPAFKWMAMAQSCKVEDRARENFARGLEAQRSRTIPTTVQQFLKKLLRQTERKISLHGGSILGTIRSTCLYWDSDSTGELSVPQFERVLAALHVQVSREMQREVFAFYMGQHGLKYGTMLADAKAFEPTLVQHREFKPSEKASSTSRDGSNSGRRRLPEDVAWFVKAVKEVVNRKMVNEGDSEFSIVRAAFVANGNDFRRAMRSLGVKMTAEQCDRIMAFYGQGAYTQPHLLYKQLLEAVTADAWHFLQHPEMNSEQIAQKNREADENPFLNHTHRPAPSKVVEDVHLRVKRRLHQIMTSVGGSVRSILTEAFVDWDAALEGSLDVAHLRGALGKLACPISEDEALQLIRYFDRTGGRSDRLVYEYLIRDLTHDETHFMRQPSVRAINESLSQNPTARAPPAAAAAINEIKRAVESFCRKSGGAVVPRDLLHGTFLRFDTERCGRLTRERLVAVLHELRAKVTNEQLDVLMPWMDSNGSGMFDYRMCATQLYGNPQFRPSPAEAALPGIARITPRDKAKVVRKRKKELLVEKLKILRKVQEIEKSQQRLLAAKQSRKEAVDSAKVVPM